MRRDVLIVLFILGVLFFTWPLMSIVKDGQAVYLFVVWLIFILLMLAASLFPHREDGG
jgi:hypothetical protein